MRALLGFQPTICRAAWSWKWLQGLLSKLTVTPAGCQGARSLTNLTPYACSCSQTPSQRIFKSFKPRISIAWIIKPKKQLVTAFPNTKAIYFSLPTTLCTLCLSFARPNISNFLYEHGNKEEITSKNRVTQIDSRVAQVWLRLWQQVCCPRRYPRWTCRRIFFLSSGPSARLSMSVNHKAQAEGLSFTQKFPTHLSSLLILDKDLQAYTQGHLPYDQS